MDTAIHFLPHPHPPLLIPPTVVPDPPLLIPPTVNPDPPLLIPPTVSPDPPLLIPPVVNPDPPQPPAMVCAFKILPFKLKAKLLQTR